MRSTNLLGRIARVAALVAALALSACGGDSDAEADRGAVEDEAACLERAGATVTVAEADLDFIANTALGGALKATLPANVVTIAFGETRAGATRLLRAYQRFAGPEVNLRRVLERRGNAVLLWTAPPADIDRATVARCVEEGRS